MPTSYVVTGANRGLGLEWVRQLAERDDTIVVAVIRSLANATDLNALDKKNVHVVQGDITDIKSIEKAAAETARITGGKLDVLINNAAYVNSKNDTLTEYEGRQEELVQALETNFHINVTGTILATNAFLPLLKDGALKKVITISSGLGDPDSALAGDHAGHAPYSISKAAVTMLNTKYAVEFKNEGFTFVALSPGLVNTRTTPPTPEQIKAYEVMVTRIQKVKPSFQGAMQPKQSVIMQLDVIDKLTPSDTGKFLSHNGNRDWL